MAFGGQDQDQELEQQIRPPTLTTSGSDLSLSSSPTTFFSTFLSTLEEGIEVTSALSNFNS